MEESDKFPLISASGFDPSRYVESSVVNQLGKARSRPLCATSRRNGPDRQRQSTSANEAFLKVNVGVLSIWPRESIAAHNINFIRPMRGSDGL